MGTYTKQNIWELSKFKQINARATILSMWDWNVWDRFQQPEIFDFINYGQSITI